MESSEIPTIRRKIARPILIGAMAAGALLGAGKLAAQNHNGAPRSPATAPSDMPVASTEAPTTVHVSPTTEVPSTTVAPETTTTEAPTTSATTPTTLNDGNYTFNPNDPNLHGGPNTPDYGPVTGNDINTPQS